MNMKRTISSILAALFLASSLTACAASGDPVESDGGMTSSTETETEASYFPDIEKTDYNGATFRMIGWSTGGWYFAESYGSGQDGEGVLNDTIYEMNTLIEEHLGVSFELEECNEYVLGKIRPSMMAGDDTYQLCITHPYYDVSSFITRGYALDFNDLPDFSIDQPYWNQSVMDSLSYNDHYYIGMGDICRYTIYMLYCNKNLMQDAGISVPYEDVRNGTWTLDNMVGLTTDLYVDNGDGERNNQDIYGFAALWDVGGAAFMQAGDIYVMDRDADDNYVLSMYGDRLIDLYDVLLKWSKDQSVYIWSYPDRENAAVFMDFKDGRSYFTLDALGTQYLDAKFAVGMLPLPKYDEAQADYAHVHWGNNLAIPSTIHNKAMVGQVLELMGYYSRTLVREKYYDDVLQLRVSEAPDDRDMVELICDTIVFDPAIAFCDSTVSISNLVYTVCLGIRGGTDNIASYYQTNERPAKKWLNSLNRRKDS